MGPPVDFNQKGFIVIKYQARFQGHDAILLWGNENDMYGARDFFKMLNIKGSSHIFWKGSLYKKRIEIVHFFKFCGRKRLVNKSPLGLISFFYFFCWMEKKVRNVLFPDSKWNSLFTFCFSDLFFQLLDRIDKNVLTAEFLSIIYTK